MYEVFVHVIDVTDDNNWANKDLISIGKFDDKETAIAKMVITKIGYQVKGWKFEDMSMLGDNVKLSEEKMHERICIGIKKEEP